MKIELEIEQLDNGMLVRVDGKKRFCKGARDLMRLLLERIGAGKEINKDNWKTEATRNAVFNEKNKEMMQEAWQNMIGEKQLLMLGIAQKVGFISKSSSYAKLNKSFMYHRGLHNESFDRLVATEFLKLHSRLAKFDLTSKGKLLLKQVGKTKLKEVAEKYNMGDVI